MKRSCILFISMILNVLPMLAQNISKCELCESIIEEGRNRFFAEKYEEARDLFTGGIELGITRDDCPDCDFRHWIGECDKKIKDLKQIKLFEEGESAYQKGSYEVAKTKFEEGLKLGANEKLDFWSRIKDCTGHLEEQRKIILAEENRKREEEEQERRKEERMAAFNAEIGKDMVFVEGGMFEEHKVVIRDFYIGKYEFTQKLWVSVSGKNPSTFTGENFPVDNISWNDVQALIDTINVLTGKKYRLPTELEWEYAASGGQNSKKTKFSGNDDADFVAWYSKNARNATHRGGEKIANELNLYDMSGNVAEWCSDIFWLDPKLVTRVVSLIRPKDKEQQATPGTERTVRGGSWNSKAKEVQLSSRIGCLPDSCSNEIGFRLAIDAEELVIPDR